MKSFNIFKIKLLFKQFLLIYIVCIVYFYKITHNNKLNIKKFNKKDIKDFLINNSFINDGLYNYSYNKPNTIYSNTLDNNYNIIGNNKKLIDDNYIHRLKELELFNNQNNNNNSFLSKFKLNKKNILPSTSEYVGDITNFNPGVETTYYSKKDDYDEIKSRSNNSLIDVLNNYNKPCDNNQTNNLPNNITSMPCINPILNSTSSGIKFSKLDKSVTTNTNTSSSKNSSNKNNSSLFDIDINKNKEITNIEPPNNKGTNSDNVSNYPTNNNNNLKPYIPDNNNLPFNIPENKKSTFEEYPSSCSSKAEQQQQLSFPPPSPKCSSYMLQSTDPSKNCYCDDVNIISTCCITIDYKKCSSNNINNNISSSCSSSNIINNSLNLNSVCSINRYYKLINNYTNSTTPLPNQYTPIYPRNTTNINNSYITNVIDNSLYSKLRLNYKKNLQKNILDSEETKKKLIDLYSDIQKFTVTVDKKKNVNKRTSKLEPVEIIRDIEQSEIIIPNCICKKEYINIRGSQCCNYNKNYVTPIITDSVTLNNNRLENYYSKIARELVENNHDQYNSKYGKFDY